MSVRGRVKSRLSEVKSWVMSAPIVSRAKETVAFVKRRPKVR